MAVPLSVGAQVPLLLSIQLPTPQSLTLPGGAVVTAQSLGPCHVGDAKTALGPVFSLIQPWLVQAFGE